MVSSGGKKNNARLVSEVLKIPSPNKVLLVFQAVNFDNKLQIKKHLSVTVLYEKRNSIASLLHPVMNVQTAVGVRGGVGT